MMVHMVPFIPPALPEDGVSDVVAGLNDDTVVQHVEDVAQGAGAVDVGGTGRSS